MNNKIKWKDDIDCTGKVRGKQILISDKSEWPLFEEISAILKNGLNGKWIKSLDGLDERYWDLKIDNSILTLHLQNYFGISFYRSDYSDEKSAEILQKAYKILI